MFIVYYVSVTTVGTFATDWANDGVFGDGWHLFGIGSSAAEDCERTATEYDGCSEADGMDDDCWQRWIRKRKAMMRRQRSRS